MRVQAWTGKISWRRNTPVFSPGESHGQRSLPGYHPKGHRESDMTEATEHVDLSESADVKDQQRVKKESKFCNPDDASFSLG